MQRFVQALGFPPSSFIIEDSSGLSHENRLSSQIIVTILVELFRSNRYGPEFVSSLSVAGRSGTLKDRTLGENQVSVRAKTGTLTGVVSLAGYLTSESNRVFAFALLQNGVKSKANAHALERKLMALLSSHGV